VDGVRLEPGGGLLPHHERVAGRSIRQRLDRRGGARRGEHGASDEVGELAVRRHQRAGDRLAVGGGQALPVGSGERFRHPGDRAPEGAVLGTGHHLGLELGQQPCHHRSRAGDALRDPLACPGDGDVRPGGKGSGPREEVLVVGDGAEGVLSPPGPEHRELHRQGVHLLERHQVVVERQLLQGGARQVVQHCPGQHALAPELRPGNGLQPCAGPERELALLLSPDVGEVVWETVVVPRVTDHRGQQRVEPKHSLEVLLGQRSNPAGGVRRSRTGRGRGRGRRRAVGAGEAQGEQENGQGGAHGAGEETRATRATSTENPRNVGSWAHGP
jgi:hypothetical protein